MAKYYSIRCVEASGRDEAVVKVQNGDFNEKDWLCDAVLSRSDLITALGVKNWMSDECSTCGGEVEILLLNGKPDAKQCVNCRLLKNL